MCKYDMEPMRTVGTTERTWDAEWMDGQTDRWGETDISSHNFFVRGYNKSFLAHIIDCTVKMETKPDFPVYGVAFVS